LLTWLLVLLTVTGIFAGLGSYLVALREPDEDFDDTLRQLAFYIGEGASQSALSAPESSDLEPEDVLVIQIWDSAGRVIRVSDPAIPLPRQGKTGFVGIIAAGEAWRTYSLVRPERTVQVSQRVSVRQELAAESALRAVYPVAALIPLSWLFVWLAVGRVLRPMRRLVAGLAARKPGNGAALDASGLPSEVTPLVEAVNALLARQQALLDFRQRFLSDTAHQLRTPLTAAKIQAENLCYASSPSDVKELSADIERALKRMALMINQLLDLARTDMPDRPPPSEWHDLSGILREALEDVLVLAGRRSIEIGVTGQVTVPVLCDRVEIRMLMGNLLDNAVRYTPPGGKVDVAIKVSSGSASLDIIDSGPGIPEKDLPKLFDRFVRLGTADMDGSGLGLAIVKAIASRHSLKVNVRNRQDGTGLLVAVVFPLASGFAKALA
jgi:two-component system OmpR family sensor kinase/two-component system sensor histidine kinase QseC